MYTFFIICFGVGVGYTVIAFLLGEVVSVFDFDTDLTIGGTVWPLKPSVIAAFITVFGGMGVLLTRYGAPYFMAVPIAAVLGFVIAFILYRFVIVPLSKAQNTSAVEIQSLVGHTAKVTERIMQGRYGKITYYVNGNTYSAPAKSVDGSEIQRAAEVEIMYVEKNTYYVCAK